MIIAALYLLWAYQRVFHGEPDEANAKFPDLNLTERLVMVPLLVLIVFLGIYPKPVLDRIEPSVNRILDRMEEQVDRYDQPRTQNGSELGPIVVEDHEENESDAADTEAEAEGEHAASVPRHERGGGAVILGDARSAPRAPSDRRPTRSCTSPAPRSTGRRCCPC